MVKWGSNRALGWVMAITLIAAASAHAAPQSLGKLSGAVVDPAGVPQMGATVLVLAEDQASAAAAQLLTNQRGLFNTEHLLPGYYSVRVTLAGFLPAVERHIKVTANLTTLLKIEMDSVFASLDRLRRGPQQQTGPDEWKWVLRTSAATRSVLQWLEGESEDAGGQPAGEPARTHLPRGRLEVTSGAHRPGSVANLADSPATAFAYEQKIGPAGRLLLAGQLSYEHSAAAGLSTLWLPSGDPRSGPQTSLVLRQAKQGPAGPTFRALRMQHASQLALGDRVTLRYGAEYVLVGLGPAASALRPDAELDVRVSPNWKTNLRVSGRQSRSAPGDDLRAAPLQSALAELDSLPVVLWRNGHPVLEGGWHEELGVERRLGARVSISGAAFHDAAHHVAVFGRGGTSNPDFFQDFFSGAFLYDGGSSNTWGTRLAYRQKLNDELELSAVYAWASALAPEEVAATVDLRDALQARYRHSLAARVSGCVPRAGTRVVASYKWINGPVVSRQDPFGETLHQIDSYLSLSVRQPLPSFLMSGRWEAQADFRNLLAQGYVPVDARDGRILLVPAFRSFRGGLSFQF